MHTSAQVPSLPYKQTTTIGPGAHRVYPQATDAHSLSPVVPLAHAVVEPLAVVIEAAHALVAGAAVLGASTPAGVMHRVVGRPIPLFVAAKGGGVSFATPAPAPEPSYTPGTTTPEHRDEERARPLVDPRGGTPGRGGASKELRDWTEEARKGGAGASWGLAVGLRTYVMVIKN